MKRVAMTVLLAFGLTLGWGIIAMAAEPAAPAPAAAPADNAAKAKPAVPEPKYDVLGAPLPPMEVKSVKGDTVVDLGKLPRPAMFMFINSACAACRAELQAFTQMAVKLQGKFDVYAVTVDFDPQNTVSRYPDLATMPYILLDGSDFKFAGKLGFHFTPATVIANAAGKQIFRKGGWSAGDDNLIAQEVMKAIR